MYNPNLYNGGSDTEPSDNDSLKLIPGKPARLRTLVIESLEKTDEVVKVNFIDQSDKPIVQVDSLEAALAAFNLATGLVNLGSYLYLGHEFNLAIAFLNLSYVFFLGAKFLYKEHSLNSMQNNALKMAIMKELNQSTTENSWELGSELENDEPLEEIATKINNLEAKF